MKQQTKLVGEFILIVVGVLVALAVESALEDRADDELRDQYLTRLAMDLEADKTGLEGRIEFFTDVQRFSQDVLTWLDGDAPLDRRVLLASFYAAEVWPMSASTSTYRDLHSTGNLRLLDDIDLRMKMAVYYNKADSTESGMNPNEDYRGWIRGVIPTNVQDLIRAHCPTTDEMDLMPTGFPPCSLPGVDYDQMNQLFAPLRQSEELRRILTYRHSEIGVMIYLLRQQVTFADEAIQQLDAQ
jgi:hypothetical protein